MKNTWKIYTLLMLFGLIFLFSSCEKETLPDKPITVQVQTKGLIVQEMTKSFSPDEWTYNYNPNSYELTFTGENGNVYTYNKTIAELQAGFNITVLPGNYQITYQSQHIGVNSNNPISNYLDIVINETKYINTVTPVILNANHDDYLIIVDINNLLVAQIRGLDNLYYDMFSAPNDTYKYAYLNSLNEVFIQMHYYNTNTNQNEWGTKIITNPELNNIYHIVSTFNGESQINILPFNYNIIGW